MEISEGTEGASKQPEEERKIFATNESKSKDSLLETKISLPKIPIHILESDTEESKNDKTEYLTITSVKSIKRLKSGAFSLEE